MELELAPLKDTIGRLISKIEAEQIDIVNGLVTQVIGLTIEVIGIDAAIGELCLIYPRTTSELVMGEVVGFKENKTLIMPLGEIGGIGPGSKVVPVRRPFDVRVGEHLLGKVLDGLGGPLDGNTLPVGTPFSVYRMPPNPLKRKRISENFQTGIKAIDAFLTCGHGQRVGIFAGSGVGKSTLLGMIARHSNADINVITLVGERGREVREFIERDLGEEGLARSVVVVATSDQPPLLRLKAAFVGTAIAEYFRDKGKKVMLMMDSVTRFAMAQREVGLAIGEPPTTRGYTPSVFAVLPKLLERSGTSDKGSITALYTVLVDGDDFNEPISDSVRGILDGHIILSRSLAAQNHFPAIDVLNSISRLMTEIASPEHQQAAGRLRNIMSTYRQAEDLINIGAYVEGTNSKIDEAIKLYPRITEFLKQSINEHYDFETTLKSMVNILQQG